MVPVITGRISQNELLEPFDTSATDLAGYDGSQGTAVVRTEILAVHLWASMIPLLGSMAQLSLIEVP